MRKRAGGRLFSVGRASLHESGLWAIPGGNQDLPGDAKLGIIVCRYDLGEGETECRNEPGNPRPGAASAGMGFELECPRAAGARC